MRYQVVVLASDIGDAMGIESISWKRSVGGDPEGTFKDFKVYMGLCASDDLSVEYDSNWMSGTKLLVLESSSYTNGATNPNDWFDMTLDTPYWYNGEDNLLIEMEWSTGNGSLYTWHWNGGGARCVIGSYGNSTGDYTESMVPHLKLNGTLSLESTTFGAVKAAFR